MSAPYWNGPWREPEKWPTHELPQGAERKRNLAALRGAYEMVRQSDPEYRGAAPWAELHQSQRLVIWVHRAAIMKRAKRLTKGVTPPS